MAGSRRPHNGRNQFPTSLFCVDVSLRLEGGEDAPAAAPG